MDKQRWERWSPVLDELLDASTQTRERRVAQLRVDDGGTRARELHALLDRLAQVDEGSFLEHPAAVPSLAGAVGQVVGAYRLERSIGQGGMGVVWLARRDDGRFDGQVAIKFVSLAMMTPAGLARFAREGRILARLSHPNIARLIDAGIDDERGQPYLVLEYVDGQPIDRFCDERALDVRARLRLFADVVAAVAHAQSRLILHRDLKPGNILVDKSGAVKLLDFGIAKLLGADDEDAAAGPDATRAGAPLFTPAYASPEQVQGASVSTATDVYALGVLLYGLLRGGHPSAIAHESAHEPAESRRISEAVLARAPRSGMEHASAKKLARTLRGDLDNIVAKALRKAPAERYAGAAEFSDDLQRHLRNEPVRARPPTLRYLASKFVRRHRLGMAAAAIVVLALAFTAAYSAWQAQRLQLQRQHAETLVEFMLGDLRKKLQPVGRLDVLDGVGAEVLNYYDSAEPGVQENADSLGRRARALHLIGEIRDKRGHPEQAADAFREAARTTQMLLERAPDDGQRVFDHAQSVFWVGNIERRLGHLDQAQRAMEGYLALARRLVALDPKRAEWQMELAYASGAVGVLQLQGRHADEALASLERARSVQQALEPTHPNQRIELARTLGWIFEAQLARDDLAAALQALNGKLAVLERVPQAQDDRIAQEQRAMVLSSISGLERLLGRPEAARVTRTEALRRYEALVAIDPSNMVWLANFCAVRVGMAEVLADAGDIQGARALLRAADADLERSRAGTGTPTPRQLFVRSRSLLVHARLNSGATLQATIAEVQQFLGAPSPTLTGGRAVDEDQRQATALLRQELATMLARAGRRDAARAQWAELVEAVQRGAIPSTLPVRVMLAQSLLGLGRRDEAADLVRGLQQTTSCRSPELMALIAELGHGRTG